VNRIVASRSQGKPRKKIYELANKGSGSGATVFGQVCAGNNARGCRIGVCALVGGKAGACWLVMRVDLMTLQTGDAKAVLTRRVSVWGRWAGNGVMAGGREDKREREESRRRREGLVISNRWCE
jgi:hypothetical protein